MPAIALPLRHPLPACSRTPDSVRTPTVVALATAIYDERAFERTPILADALEEAGLADSAVLEHLRTAGPHARGCHCVDAILGKA
jgi:hypothetical protein